MERPSEGCQSSGSTWKGLLIVTASILSCCIQPTSAQGFTVVLDPPYGRVGGNITLNIQGYSGKAAAYNWNYKNSAEDPNETYIVRYRVDTKEQIPNNTRQMVLSNGSLLIPDLFLNDSKYYLVRITDDTFEQPKAGVHLTVYEQLPKPSINSSNMVPVENKDNVTLTCQATGVIVTYRWFINESAPADDRIEVSPDNRTLTIRNVTRKDQTRYACEIENPISLNRSDPFVVNVAYGPDTPTIFPTTDHYPIGANIELNCSAESNPPAQFTWFHNGQFLNFSAILSLTNVSLNHTGTYTCHASNSYTGLNSTKDKNLTIYENLMKPNITINSTGIIMENDTVVMTCNSEHEVLPSIRWYFQSKTLILNDRMNLSLNNQTLTIMPVKGEDNGAYQCEVWNPLVVNRSDFFNLMVIYGPEQIRIFPDPVNGQIEVTFNEDKTLHCRASSQPPAQYTWQVNGSSISGNSGNNYTISHASWEHAGIYTCTAMNNMTNATISTNVIVSVIDKKAPSGGSSLSGGAIAGIVIGVLAGVVLIGALIYCLFFRNSSG